LSHVRHELDATVDRNGDRGMRILLLGGSGFVSAAVLRDLLELQAAGDAVVTVLTRGRTRTRWDGIHHVVGDRADRASMASALVDPYDAVVDVSGYTADDVATVLEALPAAPQRYVFISSAAVYDSRRASIPFVEDVGLGGDPVWGDYGIDKLRAEELLRTELRDRLTVVRPPYVYGPGNNLDREDFLWARLLDHRPILVPGDGRTEVQFCHVDSISRFVRSVLTDRSIPPGTYNVGDERSYSFADYVELLADVAGVTAVRQAVEREDVPARDYFPFRDHPLVLDTRRWMATGHARVLPFRDGLVETLDWFRTHGSLTFRPVPLEIS
jgi:2'-hydroxyisoflavone reductase